MEQQKHNAFGIAGLVVAIISFLLSCILIGGLFGIIGLLFSIVALVNQCKPRTIPILGIVFSTIAISFSIFMFIFVSSDYESTENSSSANNYESVVTESPSEPINIIEPTPEPTATAVPALSKEEYIAECEEVSYKSLMRTPEDYIGKKIEITVKIEQIIQGGWFDNNQYYRVYTNDEYDWWMGDEYFMYDSRVDDDMKLLEDDVIKVYGEFVGMETVARALTNTKEEVPAFKAVYIELISE